MSLCPYGKMDQCAEVHCDWWNQNEHMCAMAIEAHERASFFTKLNNLLDDIKKDGAIKAVNALKGWLSKQDRSKFN